MAFRCIIHLEKHDAIGEGVSGWRFNAVNGAYDALCKKVRGDALPTMHAAYDEALRLSRSAISTRTRASLVCVALAWG